MNTCVYANINLGSTIWYCHICHHVCRSFKFPPVNLLKFPVEHNYLWFHDFSTIHAVTPTNEQRK